MKSQNSHTSSTSRWILASLVGLASAGIFIFFCTSSFAEHHKLTRVLKQSSFELGDLVDEAALRLHVNSSEAQWADFNNDGLLDVALCCRSQTPRLYQNLGNGQLVDQTEQAGIVSPIGSLSKACFWFDYNNDRFQDLFISYEDGNAHFFHNNGDGTFSNATSDLASPMLVEFAKESSAPVSGL